MVTEGVYEVGAATANDIWDNAERSSSTTTRSTRWIDGAMIARVVDDGEGSNLWAKGGVMIRQSLERRLHTLLSRPCTSA